MNQQAFRTTTRAASSLSLVADDLRELARKLPADAPELAAAECESIADALAILQRRVHLLGGALMGDNDALGDPAE